MVPIWVILLVAVVSSFGPTIAGLAAYRQARGANRAVNNVQAGEPRLVEKVDDLIVTVAGVVEDIAEIRTEQTASKILVSRVKADLAKFNAR